MLYEAGDSKTLTYKDKLYVADARGRHDMARAGRWLRGGDQFFKRPRVFSPRNPVRLKDDESKVIHLRVADDPGSAPAEGYTPEITLRVQASPGSDRDALRVSLNDVPLKTLIDLEDPTYAKDWVTFAVEPTLVKQGANRVEIARGSRSRREPILHDLQLWIKYRLTKHTP